MQRAEVAIVGGGIAGLSAAFRIAEDRSVVVLEQESELAFHTTGRSAAVYIVNYGGPINSRLTKASRRFLQSPPAGLVDAPILEDCGALMVGDESHAAAIVEMATEGAKIQDDIRLIDTEEICERVPVLMPEHCAAGMLEPGAATMDVMGLHQAFVRGARAAHARIVPNARVTALDWRGDHWLITTSAGAWEAEKVVNAAGAWGDVVGRMADAQPVGLTPMRRTAFTVPSTVDPSPWPLLHHEGEGGQCYFKPEAGSQLLCSPADEIPDEPRDARPEEIDIAAAIDRINTVTTLGVRSVRTSWAGLRTFTEDRSPVLGMDDRVENFCWMVGQGGTGITTSVAAGEVVAAAVMGQSLPDHLLEAGLTFAQMGPRR